MLKCLVLDFPSVLSSKKGGGVGQGYSDFMSGIQTRPSFYDCSIVEKSRPDKSDLIRLIRTKRSEIRSEPTWERVEPISTRNSKLNRPKIESTRNCNDPNWPEIRYNSKRIRTDPKCYKFDLNHNPKWTELNPNWPELLLTRCTFELEMTRSELKPNQFIPELI